VQDFASYCRLVKPAKESGGKRLGSGGAKIGNVHLKWAFSEAAVLFLRKNEPAKIYRARLVGNSQRKAKLRKGEIGGFRQWLFLLLTWGGLIRVR
jgi:transposase